METLRLQITDIQADDIGYRHRTNENHDFKKFYVTIYGYTEEKEKVVLHVSNFKPYFYVRLPQTWTDDKAKKFFKKLFESQMIRKRKATPTKMILPLNYDFKKIHQYHELYGFHYDDTNHKIKKFKFAKLSFNTHGDMKRAASEIKYYYGDQALRRSRR